MTFESEFHFIGRPHWDSGEKMKNISNQLRKSTHRVLLACPDNSDFQQARSEVQAYHNAEIQTVNDQRSFAEMIEEFEPEAVVLDQNFLELKSVKAMRESHARKAFLFIGQPELMENTFNKGINVFLSKNEIHRIRPWLDLLFALKKSDIDEQLKARHSIWAARPRPADAIYSPALEALRVEAQMIAKNDHERDEALREWTHEMERKKSFSDIQISTRPTVRQDPLIAPNDAESAAEPVSTPAAGAEKSSSELILKELKKIQIELTQRLEKLNAEVKELSLREKERFGGK
jgi:hypothetical protein